MAIEVRLDNETQARVIDSLVLRGDISLLNAQDRARYYIEYCQQLGLNPASKPLEIIRLNGKEVLYPTRGATDQLAAIHRLNREIIDGPKLIDLAGTKLVYAVCRVTHPNGRVETAVATVALSDPANVLMKCETKAKRRATLSILGLGLLDETEIEAIPASAKEPAAPIEIEVTTARSPHRSAVDSFRSALAGTACTLWECAALWVEWEQVLREEVDAEHLHDLQLEAKGHAEDATSMAAWKWAIEVTYAAREVPLVSKSLQLHVQEEVPIEFVMSWRVHKDAIAALKKQHATMCWELHWRGYGRVTNAAKPQEAFKKALGERPPPDGTNGDKSKGAAANTNGAGASAEASTSAAPQASVSFLTPLSESARYVASADEWAAHCAGYKHREHAHHSWAKHSAAFRVAGEEIYRARLHTAAERVQAMVNAVSPEPCKLGLINAERTANNNARKHAEALRKAG